MTASTKSSGRIGGGIAGHLDVGTAKTVCLIASKGRDGTVSVLGAGVRPTRGLKAGVVVELDGVEQAIREAVYDAERGAGIRLAEVAIAVAGGRLKAQSFAADTRVTGRSVQQRDIDRLMHGGRTFAEKEGRVLLGLDCLAYRLDDVACEHDPCGLAGSRLSADLVAVTADDAPMRNLTLAAERAYLGTTCLVPAPYACGLAATTEEERQLGVVCIDLGAGTTQIAIFAEGHMLATDVIPIGGNHITFDIARTLAAPLREAERIKRDYGTLAPGARGDDEVISYNLADQAASERIETTCAEVRQIVAARVASLLGHIGERIARTGLPHYAQRLVVLTGGASQLPGLAQVATAALACPVRLAVVEPLPGLPAELTGPAFATAIGMARVPTMFEAHPARTQRARPTGGYLRRVGQWLRESF